MPDREQNGLLPASEAIEPLRRPVNEILLLRSSLVSRHTGAKGESWKAQARGLKGRFRTHAQS